MMTPAGTSHTLSSSPPPDGGSHSGGSGTASGLTRRRFGYIAYGVLAAAAVGTATGFSIKKGASAGDLSANLTLIAPAAAGGGWDGFARETQQAMRLAGVTNNAQVVNIPGAGGTIGLGKFATMHGRADNILATGSAMTGGIKLNKSPVGYEDAVLLARVAEDYDVLITANDSPYKSMDDMVKAWKAEPKKFKWTGGSAGSIDHLTIAQIARVNGIDAKAITYIPKSGGGEAIATLLSHTTDFACTGYNEVSDQIEAGRVRALGLAAPKRIAGIDIPTMVEQGHKVLMTNWRGYLGAPGITDGQRAQLVQILDATRKSDAWKDALKRNQWTDVWLTGPELEKFIAQDEKQTEDLLKELGL